MKKTVTIILAVVLAISAVLSLTACGSQPVNLTKDNIDEYLSFSTEISDKNVDVDKKSALGIPITNYSGDATEDVKISNKNGAKFQDVTIKLMLKTYTEINEKGEVYGWEYTSGNEQNLTGSRLDSYNYKIVDVKLPNDGNYSSTEKLKLEMYQSLSSNLIFDPETDDIIAGSEVVEVSGTASK